MTHRKIQFSVAITVVVAIFFHSAKAQVDTSPQALKKLSLEELLNLEVTSVSKHSEKLSTVSSAIQVITQEDIRQSGVTSVPEALKLAANLQVAQVNGSQWAISARGFDNVLANKLLVLIDGRTVYTPLYAGVFWDVQNLVLEDIDRIEVISGPGGTLWGSNAVNGVINIITKKAVSTQGLFAGAAAGSKIPGLGSIRYGGKFSDNLHYRVYSTAFQRSPTQMYDTSAHDGWNMAQSGARLDWDASKKDAVTLQTNFYSNRPDPDGGHPVIASGANAVGRWNHQYSERADFQLKFYYDQTYRDFRNNFTENLRTYDIDWQHRFHHGKRGEVTWGAGYRLLDHSVKNLALFGFFPGHKQLNLFNVFIQDEITIVPEHLRLTIGTKVEHYTYTGFQYQPNIRVAYMPNAKHTIWAAASRAVRLPARIDRDFAASAAPGLVIIQGNQNMKAETILAYELGWRLQPIQKISASISTFYNLYDDIRSAEPGPNPGGIPITFGNGVKGKSYGLEFAASYSMTNYWRLRGGYTMLKKDLTIKPGSADLNQASAESNDPQNQFILQSMVDLNKKIEFGTFFRYVDRLPKPAVDRYLGIDVRVAWRITKSLTVSVTGQNLGQKTHVEFIDASHPPHSISRSFYGKIVLRI